MAIIAIVDDDSHDTEMAAATIHASEKDHELLTASPTDGKLPNVLAAGPDVLVLDVRLYENQSDGHFGSLAIARQQSREYPASKIVFMSNYFGSNHARDNIIAKVTPAASVETVRKSELSQELMTEWISEQFERALELSGPTSSANPEALAQEAVTPEISALLRVTPEAWSKLSTDDQDDIADKVASALHEYVDAIFSQTDAAWIVIGGPAGYVLRWGTEDQSPSKSVLDDVRASERTTPFVFVRELEVDSIALATTADGGLEWPGSGKHVHYPAIVVGFTDSTNAANSRHPLLFDSGADQNYLSQAAAQSMGLDLGDTIIRAGWGGQTVRFREKEYAVELFDGVGRKSGRTTIRTVRNWDDTLGRGKAVPGLISTVALHDLKASICLSGANRSVRLIDDE